MSENREDGRVIYISSLEEMCDLMCGTPEEDCEDEDDVIE